MPSNYRVLFVPLLIFISLASCNGAEGDQVAIEFSGSIYQKSGSLIDFPQLINGLEITGYASYNTDAIGDQIADNLVAYQQEALSSLVIKAAGYEFSSDGQFVTTVRNNDLGSGINDYRFTLSDSVIQNSQGSTFDSLPSIGETVLVDGNPTNGSIALTIRDTPTTSPPPGLELPSLIDASMFETGEGEVDVNIPHTIKIGNLESTFFNQTRFLFTIDSFRTVPEPSTILSLFLLMTLYLNNKRS